MTSRGSTFVWPSASTLVRRAERELNLPPSPVASVTHAAAVDQFAEMEAFLRRYEGSSIGLHPPGYEAAGRFVGVKVLIKKISRRLMWWYVEPRWTVQRDMTSALVGYARESIDTMRLMTAEIVEVRARVDELEALMRQATAGQAIERAGLGVEHVGHRDSAGG